MERKLSAEIVKELIEEVEIQWECHIMTRSIFYSKFPEKQIYISPSFYESHGLSFSVRILDSSSDAFKRASSRVAVWLNQNYVIRLYGILDSKGIIKYGIDNNIKIVCLVKILRNNIGAHSTGKRTSRKGDLNKATNLINELFGREIKIENVKNYTLSVDSILKPMKDQVIELIKLMKENNVA